MSLSITSGAILVVDDEENIRSIFHETLRNGGFEVETAESVAVAQKLLEERPFDVIFIDISMPYLDGIAFLKIVKQNHADIEVVLVTGYPSVDTATEAVRSGAYDYMIKPVTSQALIRVAKRASETKKLKSERRHLEKINYEYKKKLEKLVDTRTNELLKSQTKYSIATELGMVSVWELDLQTNEIFIDANLNTMLGYEKSTIKNKIDHLTKYIHSEDKHNVIFNFQSYIKGLTKKFETIFRIPHKDNSMCWFNAIGATTKDIKGSNSLLLGTLTDITKQKIAESEINSRNAILEAVSFAADSFLRSAVWKEDINEVLARLGHAAKASRVYIFENRVDEKKGVLGCQRYEWVRQGFKPEIGNPDLQDFSYRDSGFGRWQDSLSKGQLIKGLVRDFPKTEQHVLSPQHILSIVAVPIFVENQWWGFIGFDECLAEREWSPSEIKALKVAAGTLGAALHSEQQNMEQNRLVTAIEQSNESITITDPEGLIQYVNPAFENITGHKKDEVVGKVSVSSLVNSNQDGPVMKDLLETVGRGDASRSDFTLRKKNGTLCEVEATISPVRSAGGEIINYVAIQRDVTEKKRLESIAEAANLMENIGYIFSGIRHEIGNPINSLKMTLTVLNRSLETFSKQMIHEFLERSFREIARVEYLLKALRNFNLFEKPNVQSLRIDIFMEKFLSLVAGDFEKKGIRVEMLSSPWSMKGLVDPRALHQIMLNLMTNSADALSGRKDPRIAFAFEKEMRCVLIKVIDNGCGMTTQQKNDLFKPFFTSKVGGTGLGLVIVKKMLSRMNCMISIESKMDEGTTVIISIPEG